MPLANGRPHRSTNEGAYSTHCTSAWAFGDGFERHQHALETLKTADPEFARAIARALVPDTTRRDDTVIRRTPR